MTATATDEVARKLAAVISDGLASHLAWCETIARAGVVFNDDQRRQIEKLVALAPPAGEPEYLDVRPLAEAQEIILAELDKQFDDAE